MTFIRWAFPSFITLAAWFESTHTTIGKICVTGLVAGGIALLASYKIPADIVSVLAGLVFVCALAHLACRPACVTQIKDVKFLACAEPSDCTIALRNTSRLPAFDVQVDFSNYETEGWQIECPQARCLFLPSRRDVLLEGTITSYRRGVQQPPAISTWTSFPLNLFRSRRVAQSKGELVVFPFCPSPLPHWLSDCITNFGLGTASEIRSEGTGDFAGNCDYRPGMAVRRWDYRSWARLSRPIVHQYDDATSQQVALLVDTCVDGARLERSLSLAATIVELCAEHDISVTELCTARGAETLPSEMSISRESCLEILARAAPNRSTDLQHLVASGSAQKLGTQLILLLAEWDEAREQLCAELFQRTTSMLVFLLADDNLTSDLSLPSEIIPVTWELPAQCEALT